MKTILLIGLMVLGIYAALFCFTALQSNLHASKDMTNANKNNIFHYCPVCGQKLHKKDIVDVLSIGLECDHHHRFFIPLEHVLTIDTMGDVLKRRVPADKPADIAKGWLSDPHFRKHLNSQIAEILRAYYELDTKERTASSDQNRNFAFCPICGEALNHFESEDIWMKGRVCVNQHKLFERGSYLSFNTETVLAQLQMEMDHSLLKTFTESWLNDKHLSEYLPDQVKGILQEYKEKYP